MKGTGIFRRGRLPRAQRHHVEHVAVCEHVRASDLQLAAGRGLDVRRLREVAQHVIDPDRLGSGGEPGGSDHRGQALDQVAERAIGLAFAADDHPGAEVGQRRAVCLELPGGLMAAAQVLGAGIVAEAAEVYDAADALLLCHAPESLGGPPLALCEVRGVAAPAHRVHQVVGDIYAAAGARERIWTKNVAHVDLKALVEQRAGANSVAVADQTAHLIAAFAQAAGEAPADEAAGAGDEGTHVNSNLAHASSPTRRAMRQARRASGLSAEDEQRDQLAA